MVQYNSSSSEDEEDSAGGDQGQQDAEAKSGGGSESVSWSAFGRTAIGRSAITCHIVLGLHGILPNSMPQLSLCLP